MLEVNGTRHPLTPPGLVIGRGTEADVRINDPGVSRRHIEFLVFDREGDVDIEVGDLGSTNGMLVDGHRIQRTSVHDGSRVKIGAHHDHRPGDRGAGLRGRRLPGCLS